LGAIKPM